MLGALAGLAVGDWTLRALLPLFADALPVGARIDVDARAALVTAGLSLVIGLGLGADGGGAEAGETVSSMRCSLPGARAAGGRDRLRGVLVTIQIALAVLLLAAGGLMMRSVARLRHVQPGFSADHLLTFRIALAGAKLPDARSASAIRRRPDRPVARQPGVRGGGRELAPSLQRPSRRERRRVQGRPTAPETCSWSISAR